MASAADAFRDAVCARVLALVATKDDVPHDALRRLSSAVDRETVVPKPVMRLDTCVALFALGALAACLAREMWRRFSDSDSDAGVDEDGGEDDAPECAEYD